MKNERAKRSMITAVVVASKKNFSFSIAGDECGSRKSGFQPPSELLLLLPIENVFIH
jgi:hypothetical protein